MRFSDVEELIPAMQYYTKNYNTNIKNFYYFNVYFVTKPISTLISLTIWYYFPH